MATTDISKALDCHLSSTSGKDWCIMAHAQGKIRSFWVCNSRCTHALQTFQHPVLVLYPDGSG